PVLFHNPPPSRDAELPFTIPPVIFEFPGPDTCKPPPFPGFEAVVLFNKFTLVKVKILPTIEFSSIPPPALDAELLLISESVTVKVPKSLRIPPPEPDVPLATLLLNTVLF